MDLQSKKRQLKKELGLRFEQAVSKLGNEIAPESPLYNEYINLLNRYNKKKREERTHMISDADKELAFNRIQHGLLGLIDEMTEADLAEPESGRRPSPMNPRSDSGRSRLGISIGIAGAVIVLTIVAVSMLRYYSIGEVAHHNLLEQTETEQTPPQETLPVQTDPAPNPPVTPPQNPVAQYEAYYNPAEKVDVAIVARGFHGNLDLNIAQALARNLRSKGMSPSTSFFQSKFVSSGLFQRIMGGDMSLLKEMNLARNIDHCLFLSKTLTGTQNNPDLGNSVTAKTVYQLAFISVTTGKVTDTYTKDIPGIGMSEAGALKNADEKFIEWLGGIEWNF